MAATVMMLLATLAACRQTPDLPESTEPAGTDGKPSSVVETLPPGITTLPPSTQDEIGITFAADEFSLPAYEALADEFNAENPDVRVVVLDIRQVKGNWAQFAPTPTMLNELASNVDTFLLPESSLPVGLDSKALLDLTPLVESDPGFAADDFFPGVLEHFQRRGRLWGLPASVGGVLVFYNKNLFDGAGVEYPVPGWTWDEFLDVAARLTAGEGRAQRYGFVDAFGGQGLLSFIQQHCGELLDRDAPSPTPTLDDPLVAEAVKWYTDLTLVHEVSPRKSELGGMIPHDLILDHRAAMWTDFLSNWHAMSTSLKSRVGLAPFPEEGAAAQPVNLIGYYISAGTAHPQVSWRWITFLTQQHIVHELAERLPARRSVFDASEYFAQMDGQDRATILYVLEHPAPPMSAYEPVVGQALFKALDLVWRGETTVADALALAQTQAEEQLVQAVADASAAPTPPSVRPVPSPMLQEAPIELAFLTGTELNPAPYQAWADQFNQNYPGLTVRVERGTPLSFGETAGSVDCFLWPTFARPDDWQQHTAVLQPFVEEARNYALDDLYLQGLADFYIRGELWGLPLLVSPELVYFNQDLFDTDGVPYPALGWTWDAFSAAAEAMTRDEGDDRQYGFAPSASAAPEAIALILQHGASLVDNPDAPTIPTFNTQTAVESLTWYAGLAKMMPPLWTEDDVSEARSKREALIRSGQVAMWTDSPWPGDRGYDFAVGAVPLPGDQQQATDFDSWGAYVSAYSAYPTQCWKWIDYLSDHLVTGPGMPARRSLAEGIDLPKEGDKVASLASMNHENIRLNRWRDRTNRMGWVYPWFEQAVRDVLSGERSASEALETVQAQAEAFLVCLDAPGEMLDEVEALACALEVDPDYPVPPWNEQSEKTQP